jgi:micrococcal nuclease
VKWSLPLLAVAGLSCGPPASPCGASQAKVTNAVDGDTIDLDNGKRVRLLLVDTPETTSGHNDCYGQEAASYTTDQLVGKTVSLKYDTECTDRYGRTLAYVTVDNRDFNLELVTLGYACRYYIAPDGMSRKTEFDDAESVAKTNRTGVWGACNPVTCAH